MSTKVIEQVGLDEGEPLVEETLIDPETEETITFRASTREALDDLVEGYWTPIAAGENLG